MGHQWWTDTTTVALLGTGRRPPVALPDELAVAPREGAGAEERVLDAAALGGMLQRAGRPLSSYDVEAPAPPDAWPPAPDRAVHLLQLLLGQPPIGTRLAPAALARWLAVAAERERRVPHAELPSLLTAATTSPELRPAVAAVADSRGRWLAAANPAWAWLDAADTPTPAGAADEADATTEEGPQAAADWARMPTAARLTLLASMRRSHPAAARALIESTWSTESARDRPLLLGALQDGLTLEDEELLERALDDRAAGVRTVAQKLLDRLPGSARAERMAQRLRSVVQMRGKLRRSLEIELPTSPDAAAVRDGLGKKPAGRQSERAYWLEQLAAGAPLEVWTDITGRSPRETWRMIHEASKDARGGVMRAAMARRDVDWLRGMVAEGGGGALLKFLPPQDCAALVVARKQRIPAYELPEVLAQLPRPWSAEVAEAVLDRVAAEKEPAGLLGTLLPMLAEELPPAALPRLQRWARADDAPRVLGDLVQFLSFVPAIPEAFG
ncbi:hypothetical protein JCM18899A_01980 [Nocardioides sp. AN3]